MRVVSFNVNSIRVRLHQLDAVIKKYSPDVIGLQEIKVPDEDFPVEEISHMGYDVHFHGQKTHYGVAILSKKDAKNVRKGFPAHQNEDQRRFIAADYPLKDGRVLTVVNGYFPQGEKRTHPTKFPAKEAFYARLSEFLTEHCNPEDPVIVMGDMNVAPVDNDIGIGDDNAKRWLRDGKTSFLPEEREWLENIAAWGMVDTFRHHYPETDDLFSWFDYRSRGFEREPRRGLRIDLIMASKGIVDTSRDAGIDYEIRGMDKPSDHCPIWAEFDLEIA